MADSTAAAWTWLRLARIVVSALAMVIGVDCALVGFERRMERGVSRGETRNAPGLATADLTRLVLLDGDDAVRRQAVVFSGSSITYGPSLADDETIPAWADKGLRNAGIDVPVFNLAQHGGNPEDAIPIASTFGAKPVRLLMLELHAEYLAVPEGSRPPHQAADEQVSLDEASTGEQARILRDVGDDVTLSRRVESRLSHALSEVWRMYRWRGHLWPDDEFIPMYAVWTLRRKAAQFGILPKRFQGQTTNVHQLPWRRFYADGQRPSDLQRMSFPVPVIDERSYQTLVLIRRLCDAARVPLVLYEVTMNVPFQREFHLAKEEEIANYHAVRRNMKARLRADGFDVIDADELPEDGFMDKDHLTPLGARLVGEHVAAALADRGKLRSGEAAR